MNKRLFLNLFLSLGFNRTFAKLPNEYKELKHFKISGLATKFYGFNLGENPYGSNVSIWMRYYRMNSARLFWPFDLWPSYSLVEMDLAVSAKSYPIHIKNIRQNSLKLIDSGYLDRVNSYFEGGLNGEKVSAGLRHLKASNLDVLIALTVPTQEFKICIENGAVDWSEQLRYWNGIYLVSLFLAINFGFQKYQLFNEPNHKNSIRLTQTEFLKKMQVGSDAIRCALIDASKKLGRELKSEVSAPVSAGILNFKPAAGGDSRDREIGWGELLVKSMWTPFEGKIEKQYPLFDAYAIQYYSKQHRDIFEKLSTLKEQILSGNKNQMMPIVVSEMNVATHSQMLKTSKSMDSKEYFPRLGSVLTSYVLSEVNQLLVFKFSQTNNLPNGELKRNGLHLVDYSSSLKNISRNTKAAEVTRLVFMAVRGNRKLISFDLNLPHFLQMFGSQNEYGNNLFIFISNESDQIQKLSLPLKDLLNFSPYILERIEVSEQLHGSITELSLVLDAELEYEVCIAANSCLLLKYSKVKNTHENDFFNESTIEFSGMQWHLDELKVHLFYWLKINRISEFSKNEIYRVIGFNADSEMIILGHIVGGFDQQFQWILLNETRLTRLMIVSNDVVQSNQSHLFEMTLLSSKYFENESNCSL